MTRRATAALEPSAWDVPPPSPDAAAEIRRLREEVIAAREETERQRVELSRARDVLARTQEQLAALARHVGFDLPNTAIRLTPERPQPKRPDDIPF